MVKRCEYCGNTFEEFKGFGSRKSYCIIQCWFQSSADEYKKAANALGVEPMGAFGPIEPLSVDEIIAEVDAIVDGESFDAFMLRTGAAAELAQSDMEWAAEQGYEGLDDEQMEHLARHGSI